MTFAENIAKVFAFRTIPTTVVVILLYIAVFTSVLVTDVPASVPKNQRGLNLKQAYADLHEIAARPHPYNSHANDIVRSYILERVQNISSAYEHVHVSDDLLSNGTWASNQQGVGVYFEGTNVLVKVDGSDANYATTGGVLFSAHYDSVSTAPGATDDGMGVATLLQMIEYLAINRPKRTAVFNINNGEEDWLNGARAFLLHPWSKITETFLNLEGAASGGRPILFRGTSKAPLVSFLNTHVPHPHANVISADAFARGVIRSGTDYTVYTDGGNMQGLDLAFYKGRSKYHTKYDAIPHTDGEEKSLWAMMEAAKGAGLALLNDDKTHGDDRPAVYFDLFGAVLILFPLSALLTFNIVFVVIGPVILILLLACEMAIEQARRQRQNGSPHGSGENLLRKLWTWLVEFRWVSGLWRWAKFWVAVVVAIGLQAVLIFGYLKLNPFIIYSEPYLVLISSLTLTYISLVLVLNLPISSVTYRSILPEQQKQTVLLQTYILTWILLLFSTIVVSKTGMGGLYFISAWNVVVFVGCFLACLEGMFGAKGTATTIPEHNHPHVGPRRVEGNEHHEHDNEHHDQHPHDAEAEGDAATETTPLILHQHRSQPAASSKREESGAIIWWLLQLLVVVPLPVILVSHIGVLLIAAMSQTLADGNSAVVVYGSVSLIAFLLVLPAAPFSFKLHNKLTYLLLAVFIGVTAYTLLAFPFAQESPLKIFFQQTVTLDNSTATGGIASTVTTLTGVKGYLRDSIVTKLPSAIGKNVTCQSATDRLGLDTCSWEGGLVPSPGGKSRSSSAKSSETWLKTKVVRLGDTSARISVQGRNTRSCRLYFDTPGVISYTVLDAKNTDVQTSELTKRASGGITSVRLWSRTWDRIFTVDVKWEDTVHTNSRETPSLAGRIACQWVEYESGSVGVSTGGRIPALEEVLTWLPKWAVVSKSSDGLVEVLKDFSL